MIETIPILVVFTLLIGYGLGFFGVVHTGILNSIASRTYAFETFRNRTNLEYFRDREAGPKHLYTNVGNRVHGINDESAQAGELDVIATTRKLDFRTEDNESEANIQDHNERIFDIRERNRQGGVEASPVWIMISYGICIDAQCGDG